MTDNTLARPTDQTLVSDQAPAGLAPSGFDPSRKAWLIWATEGEYSDRREWPIAVSFSKEEGEARTVRLGQLWRHLQSEYTRRSEELDMMDDWRGQSLLTTPEGVEYLALSGDTDTYFGGSYADERTYTCSSVPIIMSRCDSDEHPKGENAKRLSGEAMPARAEGIAHTKSESHS